MFKRRGNVMTDYDTSIVPRYPVSTVFDFIGISCIHKLLTSTLLLYSKQISPAASPATLRRQSASAAAAAESPSSWLMAWNPLGKKPFLTARPALSHGLANYLEDREGTDSDRC